MTLIHWLILCLSVTSDSYWKRNRKQGMGWESKGSILLSPAPVTSVELCLFYTGTRREWFWNWVERQLLGSASTGYYALCIELDSDGKRMGRNLLDQVGKNVHKNSYLPSPKLFNRQSFCTMENKCFTRHHTSGLRKVASQKGELLISLAMQIFFFWLKGRLTIMMWIFLYYKGLFHHWLYFERKAAICFCFVLLIILRFLFTSSLLSGGLLLLSIQFSGKSPIDFTHAELRLWHSKSSCLSLKVLLQRTRNLHCSGELQLVNEPLFFLQQLKTYLSFCCLFCDLKKLLLSSRNNSFAPVPNLRACLHYQR